MIYVIRLIALENHRFWRCAHLLRAPFPSPHIPVMPKRRATPRQVRKVLDELEVPQRFREPAFRSGPVEPSKPEPRPPGRPPFPKTEELIQLICEKIEDGETIDQITAAEGMPHWTTIRLWLRSDMAFSTRFARAYRMSAFSLEHEALRVARTAHDKDSAAAARVVVDTLKWMAGKRNPKVYGEKIQIEGDMEVLHTTPEDRRKRIEQLERRIYGKEPPTIEGIASASDGS